MSLAPIAAVTSVHDLPALVVRNRRSLEASAQHTLVLEQSAVPMARFFLPDGGRSIAFQLAPLLEYRSARGPNATTPLLTTSPCAKRAVATGLPLTGEKLPPPLVDRRTPLGPISTTMLPLIAATSLGPRPPPVFLRAHVEPPLVVPHRVLPESSANPLFWSANDASDTAFELGIVLGVQVTPPSGVVTIAPRLPQAKAKLGLTARRPVSVRTRLEPTRDHVLPPSEEVNIAPSDAPATAWFALANAAALIGVLPNEMNAPVLPPLSVRTSPVLLWGTNRQRVVSAQRTLRKLYGPPAP